MPVAPLCGLLKDKTFDIFHLRYNAVHRGAETEIFPLLPKDDRPGIVSFAGTAWGKLLDPRKMSAGEKPPTAIECYRFALLNPAVDVCMTGTRTVDQMKQNLKILQQGSMTDEELVRMRRIGNRIYG